jgi:glutamine amidotransferase
LNVGILDLGINNLSSVEKAFSNYLGSSDSLMIIDSARNEFAADLLILPGLGKFASGMKALRDSQLADKINYWHDSGTKIVGICLGMQLLASESAESIAISGLNLIPGKIERLPSNCGERIPHISWAETKKTNELPFFSSLGEKGDYYFVHSYYFIPENDTHVLTETPFGNFRFASSIYKENVLGIQFHPEKSGKKGQKLMSEIITWARNEN